MTPKADQEKLVTPKADQEKIEEEFLGGLYEGRWNSIGKFIEQFKAKYPHERSTSRLFAIARKRNWVEKKDAVLLRKGFTERSQEVESHAKDLYRDQLRATSLRRMLLSKIDSAIRKSKRPPGLTQQLRQLADALHVVENDLEVALRRPELKDGQPQLQVIIADETAPYATERSAVFTKPDVAVPAVGKGSPQGSSPAQEGERGEKNSQNGVRAQVAVATGAQEPVQGGRVVHGADVPMGEADRVGPDERDDRVPAGQDKGGGERDRSGDPPT